MCRLVRWVMKKASCTNTRKPLWYYIFNGIATSTIVSYIPHQVEALDQVLVACHSTNPQASNLLWISHRSYQCCRNIWPDWNCCVHLLLRHHWSCWKIPRHSTSVLGISSDVCSTVTINNNDTYCKMFHIFLSSVPSSVVKQVSVKQVLLLLTAPQTSLIQLKIQSHISSKTQLKHLLT